MKVDRQAFGEHVAGAGTAQPQHRPPTALIGHRGEPFQPLLQIAGQRVAHEAEPCVVVVVQRAADPRNLDDCVTLDAGCDFVTRLPTRSALELCLRDAAYAALIDHSSVSRDCLGMPFVVPGDPDGSLFYRKLLDDPGCGERMPLGGGALPAEQIEMVRSWIVDGARDN